MFMSPCILYFCLHFRNVPSWTPVTLNPLYLMVVFLCIYIIIMVNVSMDPQSSFKYTSHVPGYIFIIKTKMLDVSYCVLCCITKFAFLCKHVDIFHHHVVPWIPFYAYLMYFMYGTNKSFINLRDSYLKFGRISHVSIDVSKWFHGSIQMVPWIPL